jgi:hypothetical protein
MTSNVRLEKLNLTRNGKSSCSRTKFKSNRLFSSWSRPPLSERIRAKKERKVKRRSDEYKTTIS